MNDKHREWLEGSRREFLRRRKLSVKEVKNGLILPAHENGDKLWADGGVLDDKGNFVKESESGPEAGGSGYLFGGKYEYDESRIKTVDETVVFFGPFIKHWGHFICDLIGRMWFIQDATRRYKIAYCGWEWRRTRGDIEGNYLELIELLGCKKEQLINIQEPTRFKKVIIPDFAFKGGEYYTKEFERMTDKVVKNALRISEHTDKKIPERIYFSRTHFNNGKERGEEKIEQIFRENGYTVVFPEELSVKEQIVYFNKAKDVAMVAGSISHNLMFARSKKSRAIIINKMDLVNNYQLVVDELTKAQLVYVDAFFGPRQVLFGVGPFLLANTKHLQNFLRDNNYSFPKTANLRPKDLGWYLREYYRTYKEPTYKRLLKSQKASVISAKKALGREGEGS